MMPRVSCESGAEEACVEVGGDFADGFGDVGELWRAVGAEGADLLEGAEGLVDDGAFAVDELEVEAHGGEREEEVGEDDGGVDAEALGGGDGDLGGDGGRAADVEEGMVAADGHVLGHVAAGLAEEPDGRAVDGLAEAGADEAGGAVGAHFMRLAPGFLVGRLAGRQGDARNGRLGEGFSLNLRVAEACVLSARESKFFLERRAEFLCRTILNCPWGRSRRSW